jgi:integrase
VAVKVRERRGAWWVFVDFKGRRKAKRVGVGKEGKRAALAAAEKIQASLALGDTASLDKSPTAQPITFERYALDWLETHARQACKFSTARVYAVNLKRHILPLLGEKPVSALSRGDCRSLIAACRAKGLSPKTLENISRTVSSVLTQATEDGVLPANPALRLGRYYRNGDHPKAEIHPLTREEAALLLYTSTEWAPREYPLFLCALRTGMRLGELLGLHWGDIDFHGAFIEVRRNLVAGRVTSPKNGNPRRVDMSDQLVGVLRSLLTARKAETLRNGWGQVPDWVFCNDAGGPLDGDNLRHRVFYKLLAKAGIRHIRFHDLRHTFASLLLQQGESLAYIRDQLGHASIQLTVDTYGHLIPGANRGAVNRLDDATIRNPAATENDQGVTV